MALKLIMKKERTIKEFNIKKTFQDFSEREIPDELFFKEKESKIEIMFRRTELWMSHNCTDIPFLGIRNFCGYYLKARCVVMNVHGGDDVVKRVHLVFGTGE